MEVDNDHQDENDQEYKELEFQTIQLLKELKR